MAHEENQHQYCTLIGGGPMAIREPPGLGQSMTISSLLTWSCTQLGEKQEIGAFGIKSSVCQRSTEEVATIRRRNFIMT